MQTTTRLGSVYQFCITERYRNRRHTGVGAVSLMLHPGIANLIGRHDRKTWKIIQPRSSRQVIVPIDCQYAKECSGNRRDRDNRTRQQGPGISSRTSPYLCSSRFSNHHQAKSNCMHKELKIKPTKEASAVSSHIAGIISSPKSLFHHSNTEVQGTGHCTLQRRKPVNLFLPKVNRPTFSSTSTQKPEPSLVEYTPLKIPNNEQDVITEEPKSDTDESNINVAEKTNSNEIVMGVDTTTTRGGTLSQPCLSVRNVGATQIFPHLFLGSQRDVVDENMMRSNGITYVLNVSKTCTKPEFIQDSHFYRISVHDSYQEKMTPHIHEAIEFIEKVRKSNHRVIVHCLAGVSRSATVAIAYVLYYLRIRFDEAYRFVKEKRPSISPNFNFLGQLMEFEKSLVKSGYLTNKGTSSLSDESDGEDSFPKFSCHTGDEPSTTMRTGTTTTKRAALKLNFCEKNKDSSSPLVLPVTCSFKCTTRAAEPHQASGTTMRISPTSSLCKRRNGPTFIKGAFSNSSDNTLSHKECGSALPKFLDSKMSSDETRLVVDVKVETSAPSRVGLTSRRLGSDGFEKYEAMACEMDDAAFSPFSKQLSVVASEDLSMDCTDSLNVTDGVLKKPRTAPNTPVIGRSKSEKNPPWRLGQLAQTKPVTRHRRSASGGGISAEMLQSSSTKRRFEVERSTYSDRLDTKERSISSPTPFEPVNVKRGSPSYYNHSEPSSRSPHKFVSVNSRSPKIQRKSLQLNVRPVYNNQAKAVNKSEDATAPVSTPSVLQMDAQPLIFDCTHTMPESRSRLTLNVPNVAGNITVKTDCGDTDAEDSLVINSMSLTLSSPNVDVDGAPRFPNAEHQNVTSPATCPVMSDSCDPFARLSAPRFLCKGSSFSYSPQKGRNRIDGKTNQNQNQTAFLASSEGLKLKWRCNSNRRRQSMDSGYLSSQNSSQASSSFTSPTSQQTIFSVGSIVHDSFPEIPIDNEAHTPSPKTCHTEGAIFTTDEVSGSDSDSDSHKSNVRQRNAMELVSCS